MTSKRAPVAVLWVVVAVAAAVLTAQALPTRTSNAQTAGFGSVRPAVPPAPAVQRETFPLFAVADGVPLRVPFEHPVGVLFHESFSRTSIPMSPYGKVERTANPRFDVPDQQLGEMPYYVMASRGRGTASTSAVDIVARAGSLVYAPVTGTVVSVRSYWLYGSYPDIRIEIRPDDAPNMRVVIIHLERIVHVSAGQRVVASKTPIGKPRVLPFHSQTDTYTHTHDPHVHLEIKRVA